MVTPDVPEWAKRPFEQCVDFIEKLNHLVHLSLHGISTLRAMPQAIRVLADIDTVHGPSRATASRRLKRAELEASLAEKEVAEDFPILHAQGVVALWGALESLSRNVLAAWLAYSPESLSADKLGKFKIPYAEYLRVPADERPQFIAELLEREVEAPLKHGISRFEELLDYVGLGGPIEESVRKDLFEMGHVRNVIVHRGGIADRKLLASCPWLTVKVGEPLKVGHAQFGHYMNAAQTYVLECIQRTRVRFGVGRYSPPPENGERAGGEDPADEQEGELV